MCGAGVILFFSARTVSVWHAWGPEEHIQERAACALPARHADTAAAPRCSRNRWLLQRATAWTGVTG